MYLCVIRSLSHWFPALASAPALCLVLVLGATAQTTETAADVTLRSDATEVRMTFSTTDRNNRVIGTVQPHDFAIVDQDMVVRDFRSFARSEYTRLDVALLVDASESITPQYRQEIASAVQIIAGASGIPDESFSVLSFRDLKPAVICEKNCRDLMNADEQFPVMKSGGLTPLYDSIVFAARRLGRGDDSREAKRILILFSDGDDTISLSSYEDALDAAVENDVAIYTVDTSSRPHNVRGSMALRAVSANTGGRYFPIEAGTAKVVDAILEDFHATYTVAYKLPTRAAGFHQVRILPTHDLGLQFHCRRGYYYPSNQE